MIPARDLLSGGRPRAQYTQVRANVFGSSAPAEGVRWSGRGTANMFNELTEEILSAGYKFSSLHSVVDELRTAMKEVPDLFPAGSLLDLYQ